MISRFSERESVKGEKAKDDNLRHRDSFAVGGDRKSNSFVIPVIFIMTKKQPTT